MEFVIVLYKNIRVICDVSPKIVSPHTFTQNENDTKARRKLGIYRTHKLTE